MRELYGGYNNFNIFLERVKPYQEVGRNQSEDEARELDSKIKSLIEENCGGPDYCIAADRSAVCDILVNIP